MKILENVLVVVDLIASNWTDNVRGCPNNSFIFLEHASQVLLKFFFQ